MPKKGSERRKKFYEKHDPNVIMLRWKALRDFSLKKFYLPSEQHYILDANIEQLIQNYILPYGKAGEFMDLVRKIVYDWGSLSDADKEFLRQEWIRKGLPLELFNKIADKYLELSRLRVIPSPSNICLSYEVEVSPLPKQAVFPSEEDFTSKVETETEIKPVTPIPYWKQKRTVCGSIYTTLSTYSKSVGILPCIGYFEIEILPSWTLPIFTFYDFTEYFSLPNDISLIYETELERIWLLPISLTYELAGIPQWFLPITTFYSFPSVFSLLSTINLSYSFASFYSLLSAIKSSYSFVSAYSLPASINLSYEVV